METQEKLNGNTTGNHSAKPSMIYNSQGFANIPFWGLKKSASYDLEMISPYIPSSWLWKIGTSQGLWHMSWWSPRCLLGCGPCLFPRSSGGDTPRHPREIHGKSTRAGSVQWENQWENQWLFSGGYWKPGHVLFFADTLMCLKIGKRMKKVNHFLQVNWTSKRGIFGIVFCRVRLLRAIHLPSTSI